MIIFSSCIQLSAHNWNSSPTWKPKSQPLATSVSLELQKAAWFGLQQQSWRAWRWVWYCGFKALSADLLRTQVHRVLCYTAETFQLAKDIFPSPGPSYQGYGEFPALIAVSNRQAQALGLSQHHFWLQLFALAYVLPP